VLQSLDSEVQRDAFYDEQIAGRAAVVAGKAIILEPYARVGLRIVVRDGGRSTISSGGRWCLKPADPGVRRRTPAPILTGVVAASRLRLYTLRGRHSPADSPRVNVLPHAEDAPRA
jgi:hypothetical protein